MHVLALVLSASQISEMLAFRSDYAQLITSNTGACNGYDMLASLLGTRLNYAIAMTVVNIVALAASMYLTWRLLAVSILHHPQAVANSCAALRNGASQRCGNGPKG